MLFPSGNPIPVDKARADASLQVETVVASDSETVAAVVETTTAAIAGNRL